MWSILTTFYYLMHRSHYGDVIISAMASQITSVSSVYSTVCSGVDQRKHQSSASLAFVWGIHRWPVNSPHKVQVTWKMFPFDDVIMTLCLLVGSRSGGHRQWEWTDKKTRNTSYIRIRYPGKTKIRLQIAVNFYFLSYNQFLVAFQKFLCSK